MNENLNEVKQDLLTFKYSAWKRLVAEEKVLKIFKIYLLQIKVIIHSHWQTSPLRGAYSLSVGVTIVFWVSRRLSVIRQNSPSAFGSVQYGGQWSFSMPRNTKLIRNPVCLTFSSLAVWSWFLCKPNPNPASFRYSLAFYPSIFLHSEVPFNFCLKNKKWRQLFWDFDSYLWQRKRGLLVVRLAEWILGVEKLALRITNTETHWECVRQRRRMSVDHG